MPAENQKGWHSDCCQALTTTPPYSPTTWHVEFNCDYLNRIIGSLNIIFFSSKSTPSGHVTFCFKEVMWLYTLFFILGVQTWTAQLYVCKFFALSWQLTRLFLPSSQSMKNSNQYLSQGFFCLLEHLSRLPNSSLPKRRSCNAALRSPAAVKRSDWVDNLTSMQLLIHSADEETWFSV